MKLQFESVTHGYFFTHEWVEISCVTQTHNDYTLGGGYQRNTTITSGHEEVTDDAIIELAEAKLDEFLLERKKKAVWGTR